MPATTRANPELLASGRYYLVETGTGEPAGCGGWSAHPPGAAEPDPRRAHIRHFATHPAWLRRGVARMLYERCEIDARAAGFTVFETHASLNGEPFYAALGFTEVERLEPFQRDLRARERAMRLDEPGVRVVMECRLERGTAT